MIRRLAVWGPLLLLAALLALWLKDAIESQVIAPAAYLLWLAGLYLRSVSASIYWDLLLGLAALIVLISLLGSLRFRSRLREQETRIKGPVEQAASLLHERKRGPYFGWLLARRLALLAQSALMSPDDVAMGGLKLEGSGWHPPASVRAFLEAGLDRPPLGSMRRRRFFRPPSTPPDIADVEQVIAYLESHMEMRE